MTWITEAIRITLMIVIVAPLFLIVAAVEEVQVAIERIFHNGDKDKARRYASTRAAALRGRE